MKLENRFTVPTDADTAWATLLDVPRIAPCMPGATLTEAKGDEFTGKVKVKLGPIMLTYGGTAKIIERDDAAKVAVIEGAGKETRGTGTAKALITCRVLSKSATETEVEVDTDLQITGKPAQFGRGVLADVSGKLVDQFAANLAEEIQSGGQEPEAPATAVTPSPEAAGLTTGGPTAGGGAGAERAPAPAGAASVGATPSPAAAGTAPTPSAPRPRQSAEAIDLLDTAGAPVLKRAAPVVGGLLLVLLVLRWLRRR